jgi:hypothetical protein
VDKDSGANGAISLEACVTDCTKAIVLWDCENLEGTCGGSFDSSINCTEKGIKQITPFSGAS